MKKIKSIECLTLLLLAVLFCTVSCERPEIKPDQQDTPEEVSVTTNADRFVGTWVSLGEYNSDGSVYTDEYYYECSDNFLFYYKNPSSYGFNTNHIEFYDGDTAFTLYNFTLYPGPEPAVIYNVTYKKID